MDVAAAITARGCSSAPAISSISSSRRASTSPAASSSSTIAASRSCATAMAERPRGRSTSPPAWFIASPSPVCSGGRGRSASSITAWSFLWNRHRDAVHGGYVWSVGKDGPGDDRKQAYGHAFVLLAASSAKVARHPDADRLLADVGEVLRARFWQAGEGAAAEEFERDWTPIGAYRGQNANMHLTEACMAAFEATGDRTWLAWAESIASLIIRRHAGALGWRVPEHFTATWEVDHGYDGNPTFRPYGYTPGHWLEWTRLLLQLWETGGRRADWMPDAARGLFANAVAEGWDAERGGFFYTLDWQSRPRQRQRAVLAAGRRRRCRPLPQRRLRRAAIRGMVPPHLGFHRRPPDRPRERRLVLRGARPGHGAVLRGQARPLSRPAGLPDPAPADDGLGHPRPLDRAAAAGLTASQSAIRQSIVSPPR